MRNAKLNLIIDALLLLCLASIAGIALLIKYVLVPGYQRWEIYGRNVGLFLWGMDRHQWGTIHFTIGVIFIALLVLHILLHWQMILGIYQKLVPNRIGRWVIAMILVVVTAFLFAFAYFVKPEVVEQGRGQHALAGGSCDAQCEAKCDIPKCPLEK